MSVFNKQVSVNYSVEQMYALVSDVDAYSEFIPLIASSKIIARQGNELRAVFTIAKGPLGFEFTTVNTAETCDFIAMRLERGPFKKFKGIWKFTPLAMNRSLISFYLEFEFSSKFLCLILGGLFNQLCDVMIEAFKSQAAVLYD
jgi:ribosome-associated toxin RatA of RatAB toxin-antitoxin module